MPPETCGTGPGPGRTSMSKIAVGRYTVEQAFGNRLEVKGPSPSPIEKIKDHYRWQLWYFVPSVTRVIAELNALRDGFAWPDDVVQVLDVDPASLV